MDLRRLSSNCSSDATDFSRSARSWCSRASSSLGSSSRRSEPQRPLKLRCDGSKMPPMERSHKSRSCANNLKNPRNSCCNSNEMQHSAIHSFNLNALRSARHSTREGISRSNYKTLEPSSIRQWRPSGSFALKFNASSNPFKPRTRGHTNKNSSSHSSSRRHHSSIAGYLLTSTRNKTSNLNFSKKFNNNRRSYRRRKQPWWKFRRSWNKEKHS